MRVAALVLPALAALAAAPPAPAADRLAPGAVTCGGEWRPTTFRSSALTGPTGAERGRGGPAEALRAFLADSRRARGVPPSGWRLLVAGPREVLYGVGRPPRLRVVSVQRGAQAWGVPGAAFGCAPRAVRDGLVAAEWRLDPRSRRPTAATRTVRVHVFERNCASGRPATGRVASFLARDRRRVALTFFVRPLRGAATCQSSPPTPFEVRLPAPLGRRAILDGGVLPLRPPGGPF